MSAVLDVHRTINDAGGEERIELEIREYEEDVKYLQSIRQELLRHYLDQWVAIKDKSIVGNAHSINDLRKQLDKKGIKQNDIVINFIAKEKKAMLL